MDEVLSRHQQEPAPASGRVSRFPIPSYEPWKSQRRRREPLPHAPVATVKIAAPPPPASMRRGITCRRGLHQLTPQNRLTTARGVACRECFQTAIRQIAPL